MADPIIFWDDGSVSITTPSRDEVGETYRHSTGLPLPALPTTPLLDTEGTIKVSSKRTVDKVKTPFVAKLRVNQNTYRRQYSAVFQKGGSVVALGAEAQRRKFNNSFVTVIDRQDLASADRGGSSSGRGSAGAVGGAVGSVGGAVGGAQDETPVLGEATRVGSATRFSNPVGVSVSIRDPRGLAAIGNTLYMFTGERRGSGSVYTVSTTTGYAKYFNAGPSVRRDPRGMAAIGDTLYSLSGRRGQAGSLQAISTTTGITSSVTLQAPGLVLEVRGMTAIGNTIYMVDAATYALYTVSISTGVVAQVGSASQFGQTERDPRGLAAIGNILYMVAGSSLYTVSTTTGIATPFGVPHGLRAPQDAAAIGGTIYIVDNATDALYKVILSTIPIPTVPVFTTTTKTVHDRRLVIFGTGEAGSRVRLAVTPAAPATIAIVGTNGSWASTVTLADFDVYTFQAFAYNIDEDTTGGESAGSAKITITREVEVVPLPTAPVITTGNNASHITATVQVSATVQIATQAKTFVNGVLQSTSAASPTGTVTIPVFLAVGDNRIHMTALDSIGGESASSNTITITRIIPFTAAPVITTPAAEHVSQTTIDIAGTARPAGLTIKLFLNNTLVKTLESAGAAWTAANVLLAQGDNRFHATATDSRGTASANSNSVTIHHDSVRPAAPVILVPASGQLPAGETLTISGTAEPLSTVRVSINGLQAFVSTASGGGTWTDTVDASVFSREANTVTATATDRAGNVSAVSATTALRLDLTNPEPPVFTTNPRTIDVSTTTVAGTVEAGATVTLRQFHGGVAGRVYVLTAVGTDWSKADITVFDGENTFTATATDASGNVSESSAALVVTLSVAVVPRAPTINEPDDVLTNTILTAISGTAEAGTTVTVVQNNLLLARTATVGIITPAVPAVPGTGVATRVGAVAGFGIGETRPRALAYHNNQLYLAGVETDYLSILNETTGGAIRVGSSTRFGINESWVSAMASNGTDLYMAGHGNSYLSILNTFTGAATRVGSSNAFGISESRPSGFAFVAGVLYMLAFDGGYLCTVSLTTGAATRVGSSTSFGIGESQPTGLTAVNGVLYMVGESTDYLSTLNTTTGAATRVGTSTRFGRNEQGPNALAFGNNTLWMVGRSVNALFTLDFGTPEIPAFGEGGSAWMLGGISLTEGDNIFSAFATSPAGTASGLADSVFIELDTIAPSAPVITSRSDVVVEGARHAVAGTGDVGSYIDLIFNPAGYEADSVQVDSEGVWEFPSVTLRSGRNRIEATATDNAENVSADSNEISLFLTDVAFAIPTLVFDSDDGRNESNVADITLTIGADIGSILVIFKESALLLRSPATTTATTDFSVTLTEGSNVFTAEALNSTGGTLGKSDRLRITLDSEAPVAPRITTPAQTTRGKQILLEGTAERGSEVVLTVGQKTYTTFAEAGVVSAGIWSITDVPLEAGANSFTATAEDTAGNVSAASASVVITRDISTLTSIGTVALPLDLTAPAGSLRGVFSHNSVIYAVNSSLQTVQYYDFAGVYQGTFDLPNRPAGNHDWYGGFGRTVAGITTLYLLDRIQARLVGFSVGGLQTSTQSTATNPISAFYYNNRTYVIRVNDSGVDVYNNAGIAQPDLAVAHSTATQGGLANASGIYTVDGTVDTIQGVSLNVASRFETTSLGRGDWNSMFSVDARTAYVYEANSNTLHRTALNTEVIDDIAEVPVVDTGGGALPPEVVIVAQDFTGALLYRNRVYAIDDGNDELHVTDLAGTRLIGKDVALTSATYGTGFASDTRIFLFRNNALVAYSLPLIEQYRISTSATLGYWFNGQIHLLGSGGVISTYNTSGVADGFPDITLSSEGSRGTISSIFATVRGIYLLDSTNNVLVWYSPDGQTRYEDIVLPTRTWVAAFRLDADTAYLIDSKRTGTGVSHRAIPIELPATPIPIVPTPFHRNLVWSLGKDGSVTEIISSTNAMQLFKPPAEGAYPRTAFETTLYPKVARSGAFIGSSATRKPGELMIEIDDLPIDWIEQYWEPFREHAATGGVFVYALDYENDPENVAFCYALEDMPPPTIKAGGFGSVKAKLGVAVITDG